MFGPLRGRSEEMARALAVVHAAARHGRGGVLLVSGPPGIGKTALVTEVRRQSSALKLRVVGGKCDEIEQVSPGAPVIALLRSGRHPLLEASEYEEISVSASEPLLLVERIATHLEEAAKAQPLVITLDDVHWVDRTSRFLLRTLVSRLAGLPVVWVFAGRDSSLKGDLVCGDPILVEEIPLGPVATADLVAMAHDRLGRMPGTRARRFLDALDGSPVLATHLIDQLVRDTAGGGVDRMEAQFHGSIAHRLAALPEVAGHLVQLVAVAGGVLPTREAAGLLGAAAGDERVDSEGACEQAIDAGLLVVNGAALGFRHDLVREAVYASIDASRRHEIHRALAAQCLAAGRVPMAAAHAREACRPGDTAAAAILISAAETLVDPNPGEAGECAALAFRTLRVTQPEWQGLSRRCLAVLCRTERATDAVAVADAIAAQTGDADVLGEVEARVASALWFGGRVDELRARTGRALRAATLSPSVTARLQAAGTLADAGLARGDTALRHTEAVLEEARSNGDREAVTLALWAAAVAAGNESRHLQALRHYQDIRSLACTDHLADEIAELQSLDRHEHAQALLRRLHPDSERLTDVLPAVHRAQMWLDFHLGRLDDADAAARALAELGLRLGTQLLALEAFVVQAAVSLLRGDLQTASAQLKRAEGLTHIDDALRDPALAVMRGWLGAAQDDLKSAVEVLLPLLRDTGGARPYRQLLPWWTGWYEELGSTPAGEDLAHLMAEAAHTTAARNPGVPSFEGVALNLLGRRMRDLEMIERSAKMLAASPRPLFRAGGAESLGRALLAAGRRTEGLEQLDHAWDEYHTIGAHHPRAAVQRAMREAGARRVKWCAVATPNTGSIALSKAEQRVAALISAGHTNKSAAAELGISVNTIGTHLRSVFKKLNIQSRVQLTNALHGHGETLWLTESSGMASSS
ncbi:helix-turn-helix transcriptional regulator [Streptomyces sp. uw30]|uniref:helix-turn-helix transcriptional regulator n=1 Tax=Streptomyces sp. uw30 TaxID=1828179 RepID=UPI0011CE41B6|nr:LuxR family transcriptional regulator [Streptomyces sp. uw30]TXS35555.1 helix-turn-helix transcriptional regulator [Streptomyces sp. uw30]